MRWAVPGRVNLIGERVDHAGGLCLPFALAERTVVEVSTRDDGRFTARSTVEDDVADLALDEIGPRLPRRLGRIGVLWALRAAGHPIGGLDVLVTDTVPLGAGLSSSTALQCAVALAADDLYGLGIPRTVLAAACVRAENEMVGARSGGMDQPAALLATAGHALLLDTRDGSTRQVPCTPSDEGLAILVIHTRGRHHLAGGARSGEPARGDAA